MTPQLPPLDMHAHIDPKTRPADLERLGAVVFAATRSLDEYESVKARRDQVTIWGVGCHPGVVQAQQNFDTERFASLLKSTAFASEIGLDRHSKVSLAEQDERFSSILSVLQTRPRIASIHSAGVAKRVLDALDHTPINGGVLHWWRGDEAQTQRAVDLGCWFSVNAAGIKYPSDVALIPLNRVLTETDHPSGDRGSPRPQQPGAVTDVEKALAMVYKVEPHLIRDQVWTNLANLVDEASVSELLPVAVQRMVSAARKNGTLRS